MDERGNRWHSLVSVRIYVEGGGDSANGRTRCREGFSGFFSKLAGGGGAKPHIVSCGGRDAAFDHFIRALTDHPHDFSILLVDAEGPVQQGVVAWQHLKTRDNWDKPYLATNDQAHLMVQCMESWLMADHAVLAEYYGQHFHRQSLPTNQRIEEISKVDLAGALNQATRRTQKGTYHKTKHGFELMTLINPASVRQRSPFADVLCTVVLAKLASLIT